MPANRHQCNLPCGIEQPATRGRLYIGVRGNSSLTYIDTSRDAVGFPVLSCPQSDDPESAQDCAIKDVEREGAPEPTDVPDEPYALQLDPAMDLLYVGHLRNALTRADTGGVSIFDVKLASTGQPPVFVRSSGRMFPLDSVGNTGVTSLTLTTHGLYATSRYVPMATKVSTPVAAATCPQNAAAEMDYSVSPASEVYFSPLIGSEARGIQFVPPRQIEGSPRIPDRAFMLQRLPPALISFESAMGEEGVFGNYPSETIEVCQAPTFLQKDPFDQGTTPDETGGLLFVTCFDQGQVYVVDARVPRLVNIIDVGRGPAGLEFPPASTKKRVAYVVGFGQNSIGVIDLDPNSDTRYHVIQRIGFPSVVPR
jgi:hypothetical protein